MRISDWSSYVCSSDLATLLEILENAVSNVENVDGRFAQIAGFEFTYDPDRPAGDRVREVTLDDGTDLVTAGAVVPGAPTIDVATINFLAAGGDGYAFDLPFQSLGISYRRSEEHTSELQSLMRISYAVFCLKKKN